MAGKINILIPFTTPLNAGDACILLSTLKLIKIAFGDNYDVTVVSHQAGISKKYFPDISFMDDGMSFNNVLYFKTLKYRNYFILYSEFLTSIFPKFLLVRHEKKLLKFIANADIVLFPGGGYFTDSYKIQYMLSIVHYTIRKNKKLYLDAQSIGPFWKKTTKRFFKTIVNGIRLVILRDEESLVHLKKIFHDLPNNIKLTVDEGFAFSDINYEVRPKFKKVGISVRDWNFSNFDKPYHESIENYINNIKRICEFLVEKYGYHITFISTCQGIKEYKDDSIMARKIIDRIDIKYKNMVELNQSFHRPEELMEIFKSFDFFIGTRMHSIILNLLNLTPCIGIVYEFKTSELFKRICLEEYFFYMYSDDFELFKTIVQKLIENRTEIINTLKREVPKLQKMAMENMDLVKKDFMANQ
jgi:colanic acid/amylovoran biosynthesis protein